MVEDLVEILKSQHRELRRLLEHALLEASAGKIDGALIVDSLRSFDNSLREHLRAEDGFFYPKILEKMKAKNMPTIETEEFIRQMAVIAKDVNAFLDKYKEPIFIEENIISFRKELKDIISVLDMRLTSEEEGVFFVLVSLN